MNAPDPRMHQIISFVKSGLRILGFTALPIQLGVAAGFLIVAEALGVIEELV